MIKSSTSNISFTRSEVQAFKKIEKELMTRTRQTKSSCYKNALKDYYARINSSRPSRWQSVVGSSKGVLADDQNQ